MPAIKKQMMKSTNKMGITRWAVRKQHIIFPCRPLADLCNEGNINLCFLSQCIPLKNVFR